MAKHKYEIIINNPCKSKDAVYDYGNIKNISLAVNNQKAHIKYEVGSLRTASDILRFRYKDFREAYRKVILLHAIKYNSGLEIKKIIVKIDGESFLFDKEHDEIGFFPYMFSMIMKTDLGLGESWKELEEDIIKSTCTQIKEDLRFSAAYSFLASRNREFLVDRFANLWTAMNAYYGFVARRFEEKLMKDYSLDSLDRNLNISKADADSIGLVSWLVYPQYATESERKELKQKWANNYDVERIVENYNIDDIKKLYDSAKKELKGETLPKEYAELANRAAEFKVNVYSFFTFVYPYYLRCKYFHGNSPTVLLAAYNDYEIRTLELVNYFLTMFLNEEIPAIFKDDFWDDKKQKSAIEYIESLRGNKIDVIIQKMIKNQKKR